MKRTKLYTMLATIIIVVCFFFQFQMVIAEDVVRQMTIVHRTDFPFLTEKLGTYYGVSPSRMMRKIKCESGFNNLAHNGNGEDSWGAVQINLPYHPTVSKEEAQDPVFAVRFMAEHLSRGEDIWTCK